MSAPLPDEDMTRAVYWVDRNEQEHEVTIDPALVNFDEDYNTEGENALSWASYLSSLLASLKQYAEDLSAEFSALHSQKLKEEADNNPKVSQKWKLEANVNSLDVIQQYRQAESRADADITFVEKLYRTCTKKVDYINSALSTRRGNGAGDAASAPSTRSGPNRSGDKPKPSEAKKESKFRKEQE